MTNKKIQIEDYLGNQLFPKTLTDIVDYKGNPLTQNLNKINNNLITISILDFGGKANDETFDNSTSLQNAIDYLSSINGGKIVFPRGKWFFSKGIKGKTGITIEGESLGKPDNPDSGTSLFYTGNGLFIDCEKSLTDKYYLWSFIIKNIGLYSNSNINSVCCELKNCSYTRFENVHIGYWGTGLIIKGGMLDNYKDSAFFACETCVKILSGFGTSTTQIFENVYFGQQKYGTGIYIEKDTLIDITLNRPTFETIGTAILSKEENCSIIINNLYVENVPSAISSSTSNSVFKIKTTLDAWKNVFTINSGVVIGNNTADYKSMNLFEVDYLKMFSINNLSFRRYGKIFLSPPVNVASKAIFNQCYSEQGLIDVDLDNTIYNDSVIINKCLVKSKLYGVTKKITTSYLNDWTDFGGGYGGVEIYVNEIDRLVTVIGMCQNPSFTSAKNKMIQIPSQYAPKSIQIFSSAFTDDTWKSGVMRINKDGTIEFFNGGSVNGVDLQLTYSY